MCVHIYIQVNFSFFLFNTIDVLESIELAPVRDVEVICAVWLDGNDRKSKICVLRADLITK